MGHALTMASPTLSLVVRILEWTVTFPLLDAGDSGQVVDIKKTSWQKTSQKVLSAPPRLRAGRWPIYPGHSPPSENRNPWQALKAEAIRETTEIWMSSPSRAELLAVLFLGCVVP